MDSYWSTNNFLLNNSFLNWIVVILLVAIFYTQWRNTNQKSSYLFTLNFFFFKPSVFVFMLYFILLNV
jgi:hypothetical protein